MPFEGDTFAFFIGPNGIMTPVDVTAPPTPKPQPESQTIQELRSQLAGYIEFSERIRKGATPYANVLRGERRGKVVLSFKGERIEVLAPPKCTLQPGDTVRIQGETMQILDTVEGVTSAGEIVTVTDTLTDAVEIERAGSPRRVGCGIPVKPGDRVVLDPTGSVVMANLGKPRTAFVAAETGVRWEDVGGLEDAKRQLREAIEGPVLHADRFRRFGKRPIRGVLLSGPPGCGKTLLVKAAATAHAALHGKTGLGAFFSIKGPEVLDMYVGNSEAKVRDLFNRAREHKAEHGYPAVIFVDEADAILGRRGSSRGSVLNTTLVPQFLAEMDGMGESGAIVILATNRPDSLDPAIVRDGRIDRRIRVTRPTREAARSILRAQLSPELAAAAVEGVWSKKHVLYEIGINGHPAPLAMRLEHFVNGAMIVGVADRAIGFALQREIETDAATEVNADDVEAAVLETLEQIRHIDHTDEIREFVELHGGAAAAVHKGAITLTGEAVAAREAN